MTFSRLRTYPVCRVCFLRFPVLFIWMVTYLYFCSLLYWCSLRFHLPHHNGHHHHFLSMRNTAVPVGVWKEATVAFLRMPAVSSIALASGRVGISCGLRITYYFYFYYYYYYYYYCHYFNYYYHYHYHYHYR